MGGKLASPGARYFRTAALAGYDPTMANPPNSLELLGKRVRYHGREGIVASSWAASIPSPLAARPPRSLP
jgi:hypothetical protein